MQITILLLIIALFLGGQSVEETSVVEVATPVVVEVEAATATPLDLLNGLLTLPYDETLIPEGYSEATVEPWLDYSDDDLRGAIGGVTITFAQPEPGAEEEQIAGLSYMVFPTSAGPSARIDSYLGEDMPPVEVQTAESGFRYVVLESGYVACLGSLDNVLVAAVLDTEGAPEASEALVEQTCAIYEDGRTHLLSVLDRVQFGFSVVPPQPPVSNPVDGLNLLLASSVSGELVPDGVIVGQPELIPYDSPRIAGTVGGVQFETDNGAGPAIQIFLLGDLAATDAWVAQQLLTYEVIGGSGSSDDPGSERYTFTRDDEIGCAEVRLNTVVLVENPDSSLDATEDDLCGLVDLGVAHLQTLGFFGS